MAIIRRSRGEGTFYSVCVDDRQSPPIESNLIKKTNIES